MYDTKVPPQLNNPVKGQILIVGRDPGQYEVQLGVPFVGQAGQILDQALISAGLRRKDVNITNAVLYRPYGNDFSQHSKKHITEGNRDLLSLMHKLRPSVIIALGNEAAYSLIPGWPSRGHGILGAKNIFDMRGYLFEGYNGYKVIPTVHPSAVDRVWVPWRQLLEHDLKRGKEQHDFGSNWHRPVRRVHHITANTKSARQYFDALRSHGRVTFDIEIYRDGTLACIGFASSNTDAYVCAGAGIGLALQFLSDPGSARLCAANGQFDIHYLYSRCGVRVSNYADDTQLGWHACYPELAGKSDSKSFQATRKSLAFLSSMFTWDEWWKDYDFRHDTERWELNGRDCMVTYEVMEALDPIIDSLGVRMIYTHAVGLVWPVVDMQERGLRVDVDRLHQNCESIDARVKVLQDTIQQLGTGILEPELDRIARRHLFEEVWTCPCCKNGKGKKARCWGCAGFEKKPTKKDLAMRFLPSDIDGLSKAEIEAELLEPCKVCNGEGQRVKLVIKPGSPDQLRILLYDVLKFKPRKSKGKLTVDENALKDMLSELT